MRVLFVRREHGKGQPLLRFLTIALLVSIGTSAAEPPPDIEMVLLEMAQEGRKFKPDKLHKGGLKTLEALLDHLLPDTIPVEPASVSQAQAQQWLEQLGDEDYRTREDATQKLISLGESFKALVKKALDDEDIEIRTRAQLILSTWEAARQNPESRNVGIYSGAFGVYVDGITDPECLRELARRVRRGVKCGLPATKGELRLFEHCLRVVAESGDDATCNILTPLLEHEDPAVAVWVVKQVGAYSDNNYFPELLLVALASDVEDIVSEAISWTPNCWDEDRAPLVVRHLTRIFEGDNETLKFKACFPLMHGHHDRRAVAYLIEQTQSADPVRARRAISWLGDSCNHRKKAYPALLEALVPLLSCKDPVTRRTAADALGTYLGEEVVKQLIPLLADDENIIVMETRQNLLEQKDKVMLRRLLAQAQTESPNPLVRERAAALLKALDSSK